MKYALITDIHGNMPALRLVLEDAQAQGVDGYLLGGDYAIRAPWFNEVTETLRSLPNAFAVTGNEERYFRMTPGEDAQFAICYWVMRTLTEDNLAWLNSLPDRLDLTLEGVPVHLAHQPDPILGRDMASRLHTRFLPLRYPNPPVSPGRFQADIRRLLTGSPSFQRVIGSLPGGVYIFGHNHTQWQTRFGNRLFINPGSCGQPIDCMKFGACYAVLTIENGEYSADLIRIPYDPEPLIEQVMASDQFRCAPVWSSLVFMDWRTCTGHISPYLSYLRKYADRIGDARRPYMRDTFQAAFEAWKADGCPVRPE